MSMTQHYVRPQYAPLTLLLHSLHPVHQESRYCFPGVLQSRCHRTRRTQRTNTNAYQSLGLLKLMPQNAFHDRPGVPPPKKLDQQPWVRLWSSLNCSGPVLCHLRSSLDIQSLPLLGFWRLQFSTDVSAAKPTTNHPLPGLAPSPPQIPPPALQTRQRRIEVRRSGLDLKFLLLPRLAFLVGLSKLTLQTQVMG
jgi:hypothetical protein